MTNVEDKINAIKSLGLRVFKAKIAGQDVIYRSISRTEFRALQKALVAKTEAFKKNEENGEAQIAMLKDDGEEKLVLLALISPQVASELDLTVLHAGLIPTLAELIMTASGFNEDVEPVEL